MAKRVCPGLQALHHANVRVVKVMQVLLDFSVSIHKCRLFSHWSPHLTGICVY